MHVTNKVVSKCCNKPNVTSRRSSTLGRLAIFALRDKVTGVIIVLFVGGKYTYGEDDHLSLKFFGEDFNSYWKEVEESGSLSLAARRCVLTKCRAFIVAVADSIISRFPEQNLITSMGTFVNPMYRTEHIKLSIFKLFWIVSIMNSWMVMQSLEATICTEMMTC